MTASCLRERLIVVHRGIPFELRISNKLTAQTLANSEQGLNMHEASSVDGLEHTGSHSELFE
jgi:antitoxin component of RelBE/YafQ-DinJ toxin-antitoxin module